MVRGGKGLDVKNRTSKTSPSLPTKIDEYRIEPGRVLRAGTEAKIRVAGRKSLLRATFRYADEFGGLTFTDPRNGAQRTVRPDAVITICRATKLRGAK